MTPSKMTTSIMTLSKLTLNILTLSILTLSILTLSILTLSTLTLGITMMEEHCDIECLCWVSHKSPLHFQVPFYLARIRILDPIHVAYVSWTSDQLTTLDQMFKTLLFINTNEK